MLLDQPVFTDELNPDTTEEIPASGIVEDPQTQPLPEASNAPADETSADETSAGSATEADESAAADGSAKPETRS